MKTLTVKGMHCKSCSMLVTDALEDIGASDIKIELDEVKKIGKVSFNFSGDLNEAVKVIEADGYNIQ